MVARLNAWTVGVANLALTGLLALLVTHERGSTGDEPFYLAMAAHPGRPHTFPYAYRVGVPWIVHILPFSDRVSFTILGLIAVGVSAGALYLLMREFGVQEWLSAGLVVGFTLSPVLWIVVIRHFISIDPASIMVMILAVLFTVRRQRLALLITLTLGTAVRESTMFLVPFTYVAWARRPLDAEALRDTLATCLLPVVVYVLIRTQVTAVDKNDVPGYAGSFISARINLLKAAPWGAEIRRMAYTFGPLWLAAPLALYRPAITLPRTRPNGGDAAVRFPTVDQRTAAADARAWAFSWRGLVIVVLCAASLTYAYDWDRVIFLAAPVFYVAAAVVVSQRRRLAVALVTVLLLVDIGYGIYLQVDGVSHGIDSTQSTVPVV